MTDPKTTLAAWILALTVLGCLCYAVHRLQAIGLRGCLYLLSARLEAAGDAVGHYRQRSAEYGAAAMEKAGVERTAERVDGSTVLSAVLAGVTDRPTFSIEADET